MPGLAEGVAGEHIAHRGDCFINSFGDDHALAGCQAIGLDHDRCAHFPDERFGRDHVREIAIGGGRNFMTCEKVLGEGLGTFELCRGLGWPEATQAGGAETVHHPQHQRYFGTDDGEINFVALCELQQTVHILGGNRDILALGLARGAGIAGRDEDLLHARRLRRFPRQRVFASAAADDQHLHNAESSLSEKWWLEISMRFVR